MTWTPIVGRAFSASAFDAYVRGLTWPAWKPTGIVLHNTGNPNLAGRPNGFTAQHMQNLVGYYRDTQKWSAGPHLFVDDHQIWAFTPLTSRGVHSPSWNATTIGIEMLGDFSVDDFRSGRGAIVRHNTVNAAASLCQRLGIDPAKIRMHREDPKTTHRGCPGKTVDKAEMIAAVIARMAPPADAA
jgi:N-acetylmuramoyl-L-alanine amidase CwlA